MNKAGPGCGASSLDDLETFILHRDYRPGKAHDFNPSTWEARISEYSTNLVCTASSRPTSDPKRKEKMDSIVLDLPSHICLHSHTQRPKDVMARVFKHRQRQVDL